MNNNTKVKSRLRLKPAKKWTEREEKLLIEYLLQNKMDFESPTAQIYYRRFCYEKNLSIEWQLVRSKVRNMRMSYTRTKSALESIGDDIESGNETVKKCNYYNELDMIFSQLYLESANNSWEQNKIRFSKKSIADTDDSANNTWEQSKIKFGKNSIADTDDSTTAVSERSELDILPSSSTAAKRNGDFNKTSTSDFIKTEESVCLSEPSLFSIMEHDVDMDVNTRNKVLSIEERKLDLEEKKLLLQEKKMNSNEKIKIYKINSREKLKMIEMEMHERLALEELKLKYK